MLENRFIRPSHFPWRAPILFVKKKNESLRMCINYRKLSKVTVKNKYLLYKIDDLFDQLRGPVVFSKIYLLISYHQVRVAKWDIPMIVFRIRYRYFEFIVMPFRLTKAFIVFINLINKVS